ncbi:FAD/NAD(P)-binding domain-containing protein [Gonapodya prolifera JEL478]|uniref:FAD/NAD(P)-binding domain-containing protein n=1 Tax=Gonapodya prolifera (strain JEL478) TaxID=1344416 RepID=A0A139AIF5_GONPJ|nr:FAD/NAD(P)-binding domain-containing protein [Gonapodya prolifera JEL478]|eukprot:KXS16324.1 FAD/NAD(P)-binding domain-containing protein [Gonapodya prolifera JEL478]
MNVIPSPADYKNVVVVGGSFAGVAAVNGLKGRLPQSHRVVLIEPRSTFHFAFAFPRAAVLSGFEDSLFIPYDRLFASPEDGLVLRCKAVQVAPDYVVVDRPVQLGRTEPTTVVPFKYLIYAAGATHPSPTSLSDTGTKQDSVRELKDWQDKIQHARSILVVGGGGSGVELAAEIADKYGAAKKVTLAHSRDKYFGLYGGELDRVLTNVLGRLGVQQIKGERVVVPSGGFPKDGVARQVKTTSGSEIVSDLQILCTGLTPNTSALRQHFPHILNASGFIPTLATSQIHSPSHPHIFAVGDVTNHPHKTAKEGMRQAGIAAENILAMARREAKGRAPPTADELEQGVAMGAKIHLTMGHTADVFARIDEAGRAEASERPYRAKGGENLGAGRIWRRLGHRDSESTQGRFGFLGLGGWGGWRGGRRGEGEGEGEGSDRERRGGRRHRGHHGHHGRHHDHHRGHEHNHGGHHGHAHDHGHPYGGRGMHVPSAMA